VGGGIGIGLNENKKTFQLSQGLAFSTWRYEGQNFVRGELYSMHNGIGIFIQSRASISYLNKRKEEKIVLQLFFSKGLRNMITHTLNYSYGYTPAGIGSGASVTNYKFNTRGSSFGATLNFPIYISHKNVKHQIK
jgi:hypothetical protein